LSNRFYSLVQFWLNPNGSKALGAIGLILLMQILCGFFVYFSGGTFFAYLHLMYIPIVLAGLAFSVKGGLIAGGIAGLILGPWMPVDVIENIQQPTLSWVTRAVLFMIIGAVAGLGSYVFRKYLNELEFRFTTNPVTQLPNLNGLCRLFEAYSALWQAMTVLEIEIRNINALERSIGPGGVEELLRSIVKEIKKFEFYPDIIGHTHTTGFILIFKRPFETQRFLKYLQESLPASYIINDIPIFVELYYSTIQYPEDGANFHELLRKLKVALAHSRKRAQQLTVYDPLLHDSSTQNIRILHELMHALENGELELYYQPKVCMTTMKTVGVEALARWNHPHKGLLAPDKFIPLAERTLLIDPFTRWLIQQGLKDIASVHQAGFDISIALNFSTRNFHNPALFQEMMDILREKRVSPSKIEVEITETDVFTDVPVILSVLKKLRESGIQLVVDDFGTGQASQKYLFELPVDGIKIDQIFVRALGERPAAEAIISSAVSLANQLNLSLVAEGVETEEQKKALLALGCTLAQGFLFAKPMPLKDLIGWLSVHGGFDDANVRHLT
jgi:EAL domain-containing protein (putative c-di-GMP-specific phosphodiesterase class I)/GGDEF domain-containing protein